MLKMVGRSAPTEDTIANYSMIISSLSSFYRSFDVRVYLFISVHSLFEGQNPPLFLLNPFIVKPPTFWNISNPLSNIKTPIRQIFSFRGRGGSTPPPL